MAKKFSGSITFPAVTGSEDQYDIYLYAKPGTKQLTTLSQGLRMVLWILMDLLVLILY